MSRKRLIRRGLAGAAALVVTSALAVGGVTVSPAAHAVVTVKTTGAVKTTSTAKILRADGVAPGCPSGLSRLYPATSTAPYRGVILCSGSLNALRYYVQILDLDQGASMRVMSSPINPGSGPDSQFSRVPGTTDGWFQRIQQGQYGTTPSPSDLYSVVNAGYSRNVTPFVSQTAMSLPEVRNFFIDTPGYTYHCNVSCPTGSGNEFVQGDWDAAKMALKLGTPPGQTQFVAVDTFPTHYTMSDISNMTIPSNSGTKAWDAVVGFTDHTGPLTANPRTYVGVSSNRRKVYVVVTIDDVSEADMRTIFSNFPVIPSNMIKMDGGGSTQMTTRSGTNRASQDCSSVSTGFVCRTLPEVFAIYEGNPARSDNGMAVGDLNSDGRGDVIGRKSNGELWRFMNSGNNGNPFPGSGNIIGPDWNQFNWWLSDRVDGDYYADIVAASPDGSLWLYKNTGNPNIPFNSRILIGSGWGVYSNVALGNLNPEDGRADIIATKPDGTMWRYINTLNDNAPFNTPTQIGTGWQAYNRIKLGDLNRDLLDDIVATKPDGTLVVNTNTMTSKTSGFSIYQPKAIGSGWQNIDRFAVADVTGDAFDDIVATKPDGTLVRYTNNYPAFFSYNGAPITSDIFTAPTLVGQGWQPYN